MKITYWVRWKQKIQYVDSDNLDATIEELLNQGAETTEITIGIEL